ncbi:MAG: RNA polymerase-binding protein RbpA [Actinomycetes bacterium]
MSDRSLRGSNLGSRSTESESGVALAPRQTTEYVCPEGHVTAVPFSTEAEVPAVWECGRCGAQALMRNGTRPDEKPGKAPRTHWDMLLERRTIPELQELLAERLELLRSGALQDKRSA